MSQQLSRAAVSAIACGAFIVLLSFGIRSSFGFFLQPMSLDLGWGREVFALAMAIQNLLWDCRSRSSARSPTSGARRTIVGGSLLYILGVYLMSTTSSPARAVFQRRVLVGLGLSGTGFGVVLAAVGRSVPAERRSVALGITAVGSLGQFLLPPIGQAFLSTYGWQTALALLAFGSMLFAAGGLRGRVESAGQNQQTIREALAEAGQHSGYLYLTAGFFVCGWHVAFIAVHLPAYLADGGISTEIAAWCLALVGLFNVIGSYCAGVLGGRLSKVLSVVPLCRALRVDPRVHHTAAERSLLGAGVLRASWACSGSAPCH